LLNAKRLTLPDVVELFVVETVTVTPGLVVGNAFVLESTLPDKISPACQLLQPSASASTLVETQSVYLHS